MALLAETCGSEVTVATAAHYDFGILGSGFGGSLCAAMLAKRGRSVVLVDAARHPRFAIGESSTPLADLILGDIAEEYDLPELAPLTQFGS
ncbi:MAG: NAD(P)-binding protein, partial [Planctomycetaceae bacterium]|nr:NAD(P)-binding protein [Planctomycetaceae bacterium]